MDAGCELLSQKRVRYGGAPSPSIDQPRPMRFAMFQGYPSDSASAISGFCSGLQRLSIRCQLGFQLVLLFSRAPCGNYPCEKARQLHIKGRSNIGLLLDTALIWEGVAQALRY